MTSPDCSKYPFVEFAKQKILRKAGLASYKNKKSSAKEDHKLRKKWQATYIAPLQPHTFAVFPPWRILQELVV